MQDSIPVRGLHHVTSTVNEAQEDLDFYVGILGLRLVKKTVNFDNHNVYHLYYGTERGDPATLMTTFPYGGWGVPTGVQGAGQITETAFSVPSDSLEFWRRRLGERSVAIENEGERFGEDWIGFRDPSGLLIELVGNGRDERPPWESPEVGPDVSVRGIFGITMSIREPARTLALLTGTLGWTKMDEANGRTRVGIGRGEPGRILDVLHTPDAPQAVNGLGTVHHVAMTVDDEATQLAAQAKLRDRGLAVTEVRDRQYFKSIYFREPGGVLYEIATAGPGFLVDEAPDALGQRLQLPPWEEPNREVIERHLPPVHA